MQGFGRWYAAGCRCFCAGGGEQAEGGGVGGFETHIRAGFGFVFRLRFAADGFGVEIIDLGGRDGYRLWLALRLVFYGVGGIRAQQFGP